MNKFVQSEQTERSGTIDQIESNNNAYQNFTRFSSDDPARLIIAEIHNEEVNCT